MKKKPPKYTPIKNNEIIDLGRIAGQIVVLLDRTAALAIEADDSQSMLNVADRWIQVAEIFKAASSIDDEFEEIDIDNQVPYGFGAGVKELNNGTETDYEDNSQFRRDT